MHWPPLRSISTATRMDEARRKATEQIVAVYLDIPDEFGIDVANNKTVPVFDKLTVCLCPLCAM